MTLTAFKSLLIHENARFSLWKINISNRILLKGKRAYMSFTKIYKNFIKQTKVVQGYMT